MAQITARDPINMFDGAVRSTRITFANQEQIVLRDEPNKTIIFGEFSYHGRNIDGIVTGETRLISNIFSRSFYGFEIYLDYRNYLLYTGQKERYLSTIFSDNYTMRLSNDDDKVGGFGGDDRIFGFDGNDELYGYSGNDRLVGGLGDDLLDGQLGSGPVNLAWDVIQGLSRWRP